MGLFHQICPINGAVIIDYDEQRMMSMLPTLSGDNYSHEEAVAKYKKESMPLAKIFDEKMFLHLVSLKLSAE